MAGGEGSTFGKYFLLKKIAAGGMGEIWLSKLKGPVGFEKLLVIKRILAQHVENQEFVDMFFAEARVAAQLTHSNIVQIYEMGEIEDAYFIAMEYVHGKSLRDILDKARERGERLHPYHVIEIITRLCAGMGYAHNSKDLAGQPIGIIHRDLNPHNLLVSYSGEVKIIDFGIAKSEMSLNKTETGTIKGKFVYMSPEQSAADKLDKRSDIFAIGICLYEALTGLNPFAKANVVLSLDAIQRKDPPPLTEFSDKLAAFQPIVNKALAKKADERYADCEFMRDELQALLRSGQLEPPAQSLPDFMNELFEDQIESEKRMILETDQANTTQIEAMREFRKAEHRTGAGTKVRQNAPLQEAAHTSSIDIEVDGEERSRLPLVALFASIVIAAAAVGVAAWKVTSRGSAPPTVTEVAPVAALSPPPVAPSPAPAPAPAPQPGLSAQPTPATQPAPAQAAPTKSGDDDKGRDKSRTREREKDKVAVQREPEPPPPPAPAPAPVPAGFGAMQLSSVPPVQISMGGQNVGQTVKLKSGAGRLVFGGGSDPKSDPFKVTIGFKVANGQITYNVDSEPWAIVKDKNGAGLGKTPLAPQESSGGATVLEFVNPKEGRALRVNLRYSPP